MRHVFLCLLTPSSDIWVSVRCSFLLSFFPSFLFFCEKSGGRKHARRIYPSRPPNLLFVKSLRSWDTVITGMGKDSKAQNERCARAWGVGGGTSSYMLTKCRRVLGHVNSTALNGSIKVRAWKAKILVLTFQASHEAGRNMGGLQEKDCTVVEGDVPIMWSLRSVLGWRTTAWWRSRASWSMARDPTNVTRGKHDVGSHNRGTQWDSPMARRAGEGNDWMKLVAQQHSQKEDVIHSLFASMRQAVEKKTKANETRPAKKPRELRPL